VAAGNQVAPGIVPELYQRYDVIQAAGCGGNAAQAIKAAPALSGVNGPAQLRGFEEVEAVEIERASTAFCAAGNLAWASGANLVGDAYLDHVPRCAALHQAQDAVTDVSGDPTYRDLAASPRPNRGPEDDFRVADESPRTP